MSGDVKFKGTIMYYVIKLYFILETYKHTIHRMATYEGRSSHCFHLDQLIYFYSNTFIVMLGFATTSSDHPSEKKERRKLVGIFKKFFDFFRNR